MEMDNQDSSSQDTTAAPIESAAPVETTVTSDAPSDGQSVASQAAPSQEYQPNFKYKAAGQEYELEEEYRPYVKTADDEKRIKRLMEQAKALDPIRTERDSFRGKADSYENELKTFHKGLDTIKEMRSKGDVRSALMTLGLTPQEILMAAKQELDFDALPQQAKDNYYQSQESQRQAQHLAQQNQHYASQMAVLATTVRKTELSSALAQPEVNDFKSWFDGLHGDNAFRSRVINTGKLYAELHGQDISAEDAIRIVTEEFKAFRSLQAPQMSQMTQQSPMAPKQVPVIPSAKGASQSAPQTAIRSIKDLDRAYEEHMARKGRSS